MKRKITLLTLVLFALFASCNKKKSSHSVNGLGGIINEETLLVLSVPDVPADAPVFKHLQEKSFTKTARINMNEGIPTVQGRNAVQLEFLEAAVEGGLLRVQLPQGAIVSYDNDGKPFVKVLVYKKAVEITNGDVNFADVKTAGQPIIYAAMEDISLKQEGNNSLVGARFASFLLDPLDYEDKEHQQDYMLQFAVLPNAASYNQYTPIPFFALVAHQDNARKVSFQKPEAWAPVNGMSMAKMARQASEAPKSSAQSCVQSGAEVHCKHVTRIPNTGNESLSDFKDRTKLVRIEAQKQNTTNGYTLVYPGVPGASGVEEALMGLQFSINNGNGTIGGLGQEVTDFDDFLEITDQTINDKDRYFIATLTLKFGLKKTQLQKADGTPITTLQYDLLNAKLQPDTQQQDKNLQDALVPLLYDKLSYPEASARVDFLGNPSRMQSSTQGRWKEKVNKVKRNFKAHWLKYLVGAGFFGALGAGIGIGTLINGTNTITITDTVTVIVEVLVEKTTHLHTDLYRLQKMSCAANQDDIAKRINSIHKAIVEDEILKNFDTNAKRLLYYGADTHRNETVSVYKKEGEKDKEEVRDFKGVELTFDALQGTSCYQNNNTKIQAIANTIKASFNCSLQGLGQFDGTIYAACGSGTNFDHLFDSYFGLVYKGLNIPIHFWALIKEEVKISDKETKVDYIISAPIFDKANVGTIGSHQYLYHEEKASLLGNTNTGAQRTYRIVTSATATMNAMRSEFFFPVKR